MRRWTTVQGIPRADVVKVDIPLNGEMSMPCPSLFTAASRPFGTAGIKMREIISRQQFDGHPGGHRRQCHCPRNHQGVGART
jgi:hypothetical protein